MWRDLFYFLKRLFDLFYGEWDCSDENGKIKRVGGYLFWGCIIVKSIIMFFRNNKFFFKIVNIYF